MLRVLRQENRMLHGAALCKISPIELTHQPKIWRTYIFLLNCLATHRHLTRPTTLPPTPTTCHECIFSQNSFPPKKASFFLFFYGFSYLYSYTGCLAHQIQKNNDNFYLTQNVKLLIRRFLFDVPFLSFFRDSCLLFPTYHYLPHTYLWTNCTLYPCFLALRRKMAPLKKNQKNIVWFTPYLQRIDYGPHQ